MTINLTNETRYDTRGLPVGYDPHKLYEYRLDTLAKNSSGLESFVYKLIPYTLIQSLAFAIDPTAPFKVSSSRITPANRTRYRATASVLQQGGFKRTRWFNGYSQLVNYKGISICWSPYQVTNSFSQVVGSGSITQPVLPDRVKDTTRRTRLYGSSQGTFESFKGHVNSPAREVRRTTEEKTNIVTTTAINDPICTMSGGARQGTSGSKEVMVTEFFPFGATLSLTSFNQLRDGEINLSKQLCQKHVVSMLKSVEPLAGDYTLFRNTVELRDVPRSVKQLQQTATNLRKVYLSLRHSPKVRKVVFNLKTSVKDIPNEYLSFHFGWKQLWRDINDLLALPEKASKKVNFLLARSGKPTTLRSKRIILSGTGSGVSGFEYQQSSDDYWLETNSRIERTSEVRLVVNRTWDFPPINSAEFKRHVFAQRTGIEPRITDVYNLVPWTWLLDWFTGLGNYIDLVETINSRDSGIINWGMISCVSTGRLVTEFSSQSTSWRDIFVDNVNISHVEYYTRNRHTSTYDFKCQTRSDVATILDLNLTSVPSTLTAYQMSILGALLAQRSKFRF